MARLSEIRKRLEESAEAASALAELTEFTTIVTVGATVSGGALTLPLIIAQSGKAASSLFKLAKLLLVGEGGEEDRDPAERADEIFYFFAHRAFLQALRRLDRKVPKARLDKEKYQKLLRELERNVVKPENSDASFQFGWTPTSGPLQLYESYKAWLTPFLLAAGVEAKVAAEWLGNVERDARKGLFRELSSTKADRMVNYQLLTSTVG